WAKEMDIVSWDNYPAYDTPWSMTAMCHDLMRGLKQMPFMLMEQTPSQQNWQPYNSLKKPNQMRAQSYQTIARGADTIQFFQLRQSVGACEKFHGAVIAHSGDEHNRVFREVAKLGSELEKFGQAYIGAKNNADVGIIFDWENYWALEYASGPHVDLKYVDQIHKGYRYFYEKNIPINMISVGADFNEYKLIIAPLLYMLENETAARLEEFVENGGVLVTGMMSGTADLNDNVHLGGYPGPLRKLAGIRVEERDALAPQQKNKLFFTDGSRHDCRLICEIIHPEGAEALALYGEDFYKGSPGITKNVFGKGGVYYVGTEPSDEAAGKIFDMAVKDAGAAPAIPEPTRLEIVCRNKNDKKIFFVMNFKNEPLPLPECFAGDKDMLTGDILHSGALINQYGVLIIEK
ncbi:MAG: beta-galactosidase trimerization domain-containing protein, partial [Defluviitaleaceae bacterium]|nr:beta-galactosidase trimerization domain-containing protein [Defluviitaleaceae bacterium]